MKSNILSCHCCKGSILTNLPFTFNQNIITNNQSLFTYPNFPTNLMGLHDY